MASRTALLSMASRTALLFIGFPHCITLHWLPALYYSWLTALYYFLAHRTVLLLAHHTVLLFELFVLAESITLCPRGINYSLYSLSLRNQLLFVLAESITLCPCGPCGTPCNTVLAVLRATLSLRYSVLFVLAVFRTLGPRGINIILLLFMPRGTDATSFAAARGGESSLARPARARSMNERREGRQEASP